MMIRKVATFLGLATLLTGADCFGTGNDDDPRFSLCVVSAGPEFTPGQTTCPMNFTAQGGQSLSLVIFTDNHSGDARTAQLSVKSGLPSGWAVSFGAPTIAVPGSQTVTIATTANTPPGGYPVTLRALIDVDQDEEAQVMVTITP